MMRRARIKVEGEGIYHVVSRIGGRRFLLDDREKGILLGMIRRAAVFSGVEVFTHAIMDNHFHLLVRVPAKGGEVSETELRRRMTALYGEGRTALAFARWAAWERKGKGAASEAEKGRLRARMHDLSQFCKTFKESYTQDYNRRYDNTGTIWEGRFKSLLVEGAERALLTVAGYIHLNPVRAGMAEEPSEAGQSGYGAACRGDETARAGLESLVARAKGKAPGKGEKVDWEEAWKVCRDSMEGKIGMDMSREAEGEGGGEGGMLRGLLRKRRAVFLHGGALGGEGFLREVGAMLPPRVRRKPEGSLAGYSRLGLASAMGVREAS